MSIRATHVRTAYGIWGLLATALILGHLFGPHWPVQAAAVAGFMTALHFVRWVAGGPTNTELNRDGLWTLKNPAAPRRSISEYLTWFAVFIFFRAISNKVLQWWPPSTDKDLVGFVYIAAQVNLSFWLAPYLVARFVRPAAPTAGG